MPRRLAVEQNKSRYVRNNPGAHARQAVWHKRAVTSPPRGKLGCFSLRPGLLLIVPHAQVRRGKRPDLHQTRVVANPSPMGRLIPVDQVIRVGCALPESLERE